jgi:L-amino acid N-acyltransferase YncA
MESRATTLASQSHRNRKTTIEVGNPMAAATFVVRDATMEDVPAIAAIYAHHVKTGTASFELSAPTVEEMHERFRACGDGGYPYLVAAESSGRIVGYAYAGAYRARPAYRHTVENSVYIEAGEVGRGIGSALLALLVEQCEARGFRQMIAIIGGSDNAASIRLHAKQGFLEAGCLRAVGHKLGRWHDTVMMQRALGPGASAPPTRS